MIRKTYDWMGAQVHTAHATPLLAALFFIEAIFFLPVDPLLILYCTERRDRALFYGTVATISSVLGGIAGYFIGYAFWETIGSKLIAWFTSPDAFDRIRAIYTSYESWAVLIAGFSPLPYKGVTLTAGFCRLPLAPFILCSLIARGARFYLIAGAIMLWGEQIKKYIDRYFNQLVVLFTVLVIMTVWMVR